MEHYLQSNGVEYLLEEAIDITDYKKFKELVQKGKDNPLERAKAIIKANSELYPQLAIELSELLEKKIIDTKIDHKQAVIEFFGDMEEIINRHKSRHLSLGLSDERELEVYDLVQDVEATLEIFDVLGDWLDKKAILVQSDAQKEMRNRIKPILKKHGLDRKLSKDIVMRLVKKYA